ncbi:MAG TPA: hypothetical protein VKZ53_19285 [Candidatus Angelobacter sp.]|nr:hypothetical protein [Candidatus Angelobacter sp.]
MFGKLFQKRKPKINWRSTNDATVLRMRLLAPQCLVCGKETVGHSFVQIASTVISEANRPRVLALYNHVKSHEWNALQDFTDFDATLDDVLVYAIRGEHPGGMVLLSRDPFELCAPEEVYLQETITDDELQLVSKLVSKEGWREF